MCFLFNRIPEDEEEDVEDPDKEEQQEVVKRGRRRARREDSVGSEVGSPSESNMSSLFKIKEKDPAKMGLKFHVPKRKQSSDKKKVADALPMYGETKGVDTIVYSPASTQTSNRGTPSSDIFFGSGNTTPGYPASPPAQSCCSSPLTMSPPLSPPPLHSVSTSATSQVHSKPRLSISVSSPTGTKFTFKSRQGEDGKRTFVSPTSPLSPTEPGTTTSLLSVTPLSPPIGARLGGVVKAHTDNLDRYISEIEKEGEEAVLSKPPKKYVRRRYTDTRHHTTELPDVRLEVAKEVSVRNPPVRKSKVK